MDLRPASRGTTIRSGIKIRGAKLTDYATPSPAQKYLQVLAPRQCSLGVSSQEVYPLTRTSFGVVSDHRLLSNQRGIVKSLVLYREIDCSHKRGGKPELTAS